jgi:class 3 adenylate cyclase
MNWILTSSHNPIQNQVTIVCCDIEGNEGLWGLSNEKFKHAMNLYADCIKDKAIETLGYISPSDTDTFIVSFSSIRKAIKFCLLCQLTLMELDWPQEIIENETQPELFRGLRCRMGVDSGIPEYIVDDSLRVKYFGDVVHKASIITSYTQGGQVIISEGAWDALCQSKEKSDTPIRTVVQDLGEQDLKGIDKKEHIRLIIPEQFKGRKFKSKTLQLVWNDSSMLVYFSKEISKTKFNDVERQKISLDDLEDKILRLSFIQKMIEDISGNELSSDIKLKQEELKSLVKNSKSHHEDLSEKFFQLEFEVSKLNASIMFHGGNTSNGSSATSNQTEGKSPSSNATPSLNLNQNLKYSDEDLKKLKMDNVSSIDQLKKLIDLTMSGNYQLEEKLKNY